MSDPSAPSAPEGATATAPDEAGQPLPEALRRQLREARKAAGLSQEALGRLLGVTGTQVYRIEAGQRGSKLSTIQQWLTECGSAAKYVDTPTTDPKRQALLVTALSELAEADLEPVTQIVLAWPSLPANIRSAILALVQR